MDNSKYIDPNYKGPLRIENYLQKLKSENAKSRIFSKFNKRYFILDLNNYYFGYKDKPNSSKIVTSSLNDLLNVDPNPRIIEVCDWKFAFVVQIGQRIYYLYADSVSVHNEWCVALKACLKPLERLVYVEGPKPNPTIPQQPGPVPNHARNTPEEMPHTVVETRETSNDYSQKPAKDYFPVQEKNPVKEEKKTSQNEIFQRNCFEPIQERKEETNKPVRSQINSSNQREEIPPKPVERTRTGYDQPDLGPKFQVIKNNINADPVVNRKTQQEEDDDFTVISGPVNKKKPDEIEQVTPFFYAKDRPVTRGLNSPTEKKPEDFRKSVEVKPNVFVKPAQEKIEFKPGGILDMMNDFDELGLENVNIRPVNEVKKGLRESKKKEDPKEEKKTGEFKETFTSNQVKTEEKKKFNIKEKNVPKESEFFSAEPEKKGLGKIAVKPGFGKIKIGYVEKPNIVADEEEIQKPVKKTENRPPPKEKPIFVSKNAPQGNDCDWENWDD